MLLNSGLNFFLTIVDWQASRQSPGKKILCGATMTVGYCEHVERHACDSHCQSQHIIVRCCASIGEVLILYCLEVYADNQLRG